MTSIIGRCVEVHRQIIRDEIVRTVTIKVDHPWPGNSYEQYEVASNEIELGEEVSIEFAALPIERMEKPRVINGVCDRHGVLSSPDITECQHCKINALNDLR